MFYRKYYLDWSRIGVIASRTRTGLKFAVVCLVYGLTRLVVAQGIQDMYHLADRVSGVKCEYDKVEVPKGKEMVLADVKGPGKITYFYITDTSHRNHSTFPGLVLKVLWDNEKTPSINVPLADFFAAFNGKTIDYHSLPIQINHLCYMCYLPMPFSERARFLLANDSDKDYAENMAYGINYEQGEEFAKEKSRLHCVWRRSNPTRNGIHTLLEIKGHGQYVGNFLQVYSRYGGWWGEGDTIFHIDGKKMTHSPGTEDEYGSCWGFGNTYTYDYCGYIQKEKGQNRMYRWYIVNPVRFKSSLKVEIQNQRWEKGQILSSDDYTSVSFWYQKGRSEPVPLPPYAQRVAPSQAAGYKEKE